MDFTEKIVINGVEFDDLDDVPEPDQTRIRTMMESTHGLLADAASKIEGGTVRRTFTFSSTDSSNLKNLDEVAPALRDQILIDADGDGVPDILEHLGDVDPSTLQVAFGDPSPAGRARSSMNRQRPQAVASPAEVDADDGVMPLTIDHGSGGGSKVAWIAVAVLVAFVAGLVLGAIL